MNTPDAPLPDVAELEISSDHSADENELLAEDGVLEDSADDRPRRFRFSTQSVAWLTLVIAILCCWWRDHQRLARELIRVRSGTSWSLHQVLGPPNTSTMGDISTAWASSSQDGSMEWVEAIYAKSLKAKQIVVYETYNPGALMKITAINEKGKEVIVWSGKDPYVMRNNVAVATIDIQPGFATRKFRIYLDSKNVPGWNEIDAIGIVDEDGVEHWAQDAKASSAYTGLTDTF